MNQEQMQIWNYLNKRALCHENRKSSDEIRDELNLESGGPTNEHIRDLLRDMILNHNCCIGSDNSGYWMITNEGELNGVVTSLRDRANGVLERASALERNWENRDHVLKKSVKHSKSFEKEVWGKCFLHYFYQGR